MCLANLTSAKGWGDTGTLVRAWLFLCLFGGATGAAQPAEVIVVFKTHFDIGYTDMASNVLQRYRTTMIDDALKVVEQNRDLPPDQQFVWTLPGWPLSKIAEDWPGQTPERRRLVRSAFQQGRFVTHALPFTTHTELLGLEDLVRGLSHASRLSREANLSLPRDAKMTDVPSHSWILPTLLWHAGVDFLHLGCNAASSSPKVPRLFWWEGPDGSRLLTMYTAESYGTGLVPPPDWPYRTWLALIHTGDNHGPPRPEEVKKLFDDAKARLPGVKVRIGRLSEFADALLAEKAYIPVIRGDMPDTWIHGPMSDPRGAGIARTVRPQIAMSESLNTLLSLWGVTVPAASETIAGAYESSLLYGEHTWGGAYWWIYGNYQAHYGDKWREERKAGRFDRIESSWAEHTAYIENAKRLIGPLLASQMHALAEAVAEDGDRVVVFNPLPWPRAGGIAVTDLGTSRFTSGPSGVLRTPGDEAQSLYDVRGSQMRLLLSCVPSMGYCTLKPVADKPNYIHLPSFDRSRAIMSNGFIQAQLDPQRGTVHSLQFRGPVRGITETNLSSEGVDKSAPVGFGQVLYERFDSNQVAAYVRSYVKIDAAWATNELGKPCLPPASVVSYSATSPTNFVMDDELSPFAVEATLRAPASESVPFGVRTRYIFYNLAEFFDIEVTIENKPADPWPEAGWLCLPFRVDAPRFRIGRLGSVVDPSNDVVAGANRHLFAVDTGLVVLDASGQGFGVCPMDSPLVSLETPGCWKYSADFVPGKATVFVNLFNNQWTTNFRLWNEGTWTSRVRIWRVGEYQAVDSLIRPSLEARFPLQATYVTGRGGTLPGAAQGLSLSCEPFQHGKPMYMRDPRLAEYGWNHNVLVTAFGPNPDGPGTVLRLWELCGRTGDCPITLPDGLGTAQAQPVDLRGRPVGRAIPVRDGQFKASLRAFAPASFVLTLR